MQVVLYLKKTLSRSKFAELLTTCPTSVANQLAVYLEKRKKLNELSDLYSSLGRYSEASLVHYKAANEKSADTPLHVKAQTIKYVVNSHFGNSR